MRGASGQMFLVAVHCCWPDVAQWPVKFMIPVGPGTADPIMFEEATKAVEIVKFTIPADEFTVRSPALKVAEMRSVAALHVECCNT
eukprot:5693730-Lingulodinium_polyedra.AAC.1